MKSAPVFAVLLALAAFAAAPARADRLALWTIVHGQCVAACRGGAGAGAVRADRPRARRGAGRRAAERPRRNRPVPRHSDPARHRDRGPVRARPGGAGLFRLRLGRARRAGRQASAARLPREDDFDRDQLRVRPQPGPAPPPPRLPRQGRRGDARRRPRRVRRDLAADGRAAEGARLLGAARPLRRSFRRPAARPAGRRASPTPRRIWPTNC